MTNQEFLESITLPGELWKDVEGYKDLYLVSSYGRIFSFASSRHNKPHLLRICVQTNRGKEYSHVCLYRDGRAKKVRIHRLVAEAFISNPLGYTEIDHINGDGTDNSVSNLRWCSRSQNMNNLITRKRLSKKRRSYTYSKPQKPIAKIKDGAIVSVYETLKEVKKDGYLPNAVCAVCRGHSHTHKGFEWAYLPIVKS